MSKEIEVYVHGEGVADLKLIKINEADTVAELLKKAHEAGIKTAEGDEKIIVTLEDEDDEKHHGHGAESCGIKHHGHVHCHRCHRVAVTVIYNGKEKSKEFAPAATGAKIKKWALHEFGISGKDAENKTLFLDDKKELQADDHIGTFVKYPHCSIKLHLTGVVEVNG